MGNRPSPKPTRCRCPKYAPELLPAIEGVIAAKYAAEDMAGYGSAEVNTTIGLVEIKIEARVKTPKKKDTIQ